ncbi:aminotransferase class V-fold PLP-dependent enzyme [Shewanella marina]|uniref:aminotransferase class V-fold PLP-dependent enzyme n=1 Tax=Shewanella marina TaxID=487319 RepID=UPI00046FCD64|nr:aminotransferase class V-fold PLP-dependent enzyme [Shewanella marina]
MDNNNNVVTGLNRRRFLKTSTGLALAGAGTAMFPGVALADDHEHHLEFLRGNHSEERFWRKVRKEFVLNKRTTYMNVGTTGSIPEHVLRNYKRNNEMISKNPWGTQTPTIDLAQQVASGFGAFDYELVLTRNTTDGMCSIIHGLQFEAGDVVLTTNHEHVGAVIPLKGIAERYNVEVVELALPVFTGEEDICEDDFVRVFADAVAEYGSRVRLITFSHIPYTTGIKLPAKRICHEVAIPNRIPTLIDGAHTPGMLNLDFHDIDCDFYAGSGHKWQCGPGSTGILYVRDNASRLAEFWNDRPNPLWLVNSSSPSSDLQARMQYVGQDNFPAKQALADCCQMWDMIGRQRIEEYILDLSEECKEELAERFPFAKFYAPNIRELSSGLTTFNPFDDQTDLELLTIFRDRLREEYGYIVRTTSFYAKPDDTVKSHAIRISTHLFHNEDDVEGLVKSMKRLYRNMV